MRLVPRTAAKLGTKVDVADHEAPLFVENSYSKLQVPVPPELVGLVRVKVAPTQTSDTFGDFVAVGMAGSATTDHV